jgi:hypothetical protein
VRVLPSGVREFFYRYRVNGQDKTIAVGRYGNGRTLADIRREYRKHRDLQDKTGDVKEHLRAEDHPQPSLANRRGVTKIAGGLPLHRLRGREAVYVQAFTRSDALHVAAGAREV